MADKPQTVTVAADEPHTYKGETYEPGDTYEIEIELLDSIQTQKKAHLVTVAAKAVARKPAKAVKAAKPKATAKKKKR